MRSHTVRAHNTITAQLDEHLLGSLVTGWLWHQPVDDPQLVHKVRVSGRSKVLVPTMVAVMSSIQGQ
eukprot:3583204-Amphidinium_carterae.1